MIYQFNDILVVSLVVFRRFCGSSSCLDVAAPSSCTILDSESDWRPIGGGGDDDSSDVVLELLLGAASSDEESDEFRGFLMSR